MKNLTLTLFIFSSWLSGQKTFVVENGLFHSETNKGIDTRDWALQIGLGKYVYLPDHLPPQDDMIWLSSQDGSGKWGLRTVNNVNDEDGVVGNEFPWGDAPAVSAVTVSGSCDDLQLGISYANSSSTGKPLGYGNGFVHTYSFNTSSTISDQTYRELAGLQRIGHRRKRNGNWGSWSMIYDTNNPPPDLINDADADPQNEIELPTDATAGDIAYFDGTNWITVPEGQGGQVLKLGNNGTPHWAGISTEILLQFTLSNGEFLYAHPIDNATGISWNPNNTNPVINGLNELRTATFSAFSQNYLGKSQTDAVVNFYGEGTTYAAKACEELIAFGFDDWFLPSGGELLTLINSPSSNLSNQLYWTSNLDASGSIISLNGESGALDVSQTNSNLRCVRK